MDITNFTFSEDDESLQSQTLKANIQQISRQLILDSAHSPSTAMMSTRPCTTNLPPSHRVPVEGGNPVTPTLTFTLNSPFLFVPAPLSPYTPRSIFSYSYPSRSGAETPVLAPPAQFRDLDKSDLLETVQHEPFDLTTSRALDLRVVSTESLENKPNLRKSLALVEPNEESNTSASDTPSETLQSNLLDMKSRLTVSSTCTSLDDTIYYPHPESVLSVKEESVAVPLPCKQSGSSEKLNRNATGLDTIKQSYTPSADDTSDRTSTTAIIDDAFQYLKDIADETNQLTPIENNSHLQSTETAKCDNSADMNQTYDVVPAVPMLVRKPPPGLEHKRNSTNIIKNATEPKKLCHVNEECERDAPAVEPSHITFTDSSSFTSVTSLDTDATRSTWSVKQAVTSLTSGLTLTLTKTSPSLTGPSSAEKSTINSGCNTHNPQANLNSTPKSRIVIGSNNSIEESTIVKEASQMTPTSNSHHTTVVSHTATPEVSLYNSNQEPVHRGCNTNSASDKILSSTPRQIRKQPIGDEVTPQPKSKEESFRTKLMKKSVSVKPLSTDSDSVLNVAFRQKKPAPVKRKKKSLLKSLKKQLLCKNVSNVSHLSQHNQTVTATCLGQIANSQPRKRLSPTLFPKCNQIASDSCATISFVTLDRSSYSSPMPAWCQQILSTTEATSTPKPICSPAQQIHNPAHSLTKSSKSQSTGVSTSSLPHLNQKSPVQRQNLFDSVGSWLSQIDSYHTPTKVSTKSTSTTTQESPQKQTSMPRRESDNNCHKASSPQTQIQDNVLHDKAASPSSQVIWTTRSKGASPSTPQLTNSGSSTEQLDQCQTLSPCQHSQIDLIGHVGRLTAEWLTSFIMDNTMRSFQSYFYVQPNRNVLLELCEMCNIKVKTTPVHPDILVLIKTSNSRAPTHTDLKRLIRSTRR